MIRLRAAVDEENVSVVDGKPGRRSAWGDFAGPPAPSTNSPFPLNSMFGIRFATFRNWPGLTFYALAIL